MASTDPHVSAWKERYIRRLIQLGIDAPFAVATYYAAVGYHDYSENPEDMADVETSYWDYC